jgi:hypothetical protein
MGVFSSQSESDKLTATVDSLPQEVSTWTPEQRDAFADQSDRAMRQQNGVSQPDELT